MVSIHHLSLGCSLSTKSNQFYMQHACLSCQWIQLPVFGSSCTSRLWLTTTELTAYHASSFIREQLCGICMLLFSALQLPHNLVQHTSRRPAEAIYQERATTPVCSSRCQWACAGADLGRGAERSWLMTSGMRSGWEPSGCIRCQTVSNMGLP